MTKSKQNWKLLLLENCYFIILRINKYKKENNLVTLMTETLRDYYES